MNTLILDCYSKIILMKKIIFLFLILISFDALSQNKTVNVIIITTDGFRWQEVFTGIDRTIATDKNFNQDDSAYLFKNYWSDDLKERRKKLLPFIWTTIESQGQIYGNRGLGNKVDVSNPYWFSYPGYSEILCGYVDTAVNSNSYKPNPNTSVLEFFNHQQKFENKVAAFGAWDAFNRILNDSRSKIPVVTAFNFCGGNNPNANERLINSMLKDSYRPFGNEECLDVFTHYAAMEYLKNKKPKILYISYGETDEWAHHRQYKSYVDAAHQVDAWIKEIWNYVQSDPQYKNKTTLLITTDHGRGDKIKEQWTTHGKEIQGASQIWFALIGPNTAAAGEMKDDVQLYQKQLAQTIAKILGYTFTAEHPVGEEIKSAIK
jgi:hypothetical protein